MIKGSYDWVYYSTDFILQNLSKMKIFLFKQPYEQKVYNQIEATFFSRKLWEICQKIIC
jgi:hypothetical protein